MNLFECTNALIPIGRLYNMQPDRLATYAQAALQVLEDFSRGQLDKAVNELLQTWNSHSTPKPADFLVVIRKQSMEAKRLKKNHVGVEPTCKTCQDTGDVLAFIVRDKTRHIYAHYTCCKPCPKCREKDASLWAPGPGWCELNERAWCEDMGPAALAAYDARKRRVAALMESGLSVDDMLRSIFAPTRRYERTLPIGEMLAVPDLDVIPMTGTPEKESE